MWTAVTAGALASVAATPGAWQVAGRTAGAAPASDRLEAVLVAACTAGLALALAWLWVITTLTVAGLLAGRPALRGGATRRLVLLACGAAMAAGSSIPAAASGGDGRDLLVGLTLPERAVAPAEVHHEPRLPRGSQVRARVEPTYVVRPGDSLWSIARDHPDHTASVDQRWRAIWFANHDVVGGDPDLIIPGQVLRLPTSHDPNSDGDRR